MADFKQEIHEDADNEKIILNDNDFINQNGVNLSSVKSENENWNYETWLQNCLYVKTEVDCQDEWNGDDFKPQPDSITSVQNTGIHDANFTNQAGEIQPIQAHANFQDNLAAQEFVFSRKKKKSKRHNDEKATEDSSHIDYTLNSQNNLVSKQDESMPTKKKKSKRHPKKASQELQCIDSYIVNGANLKSQNNLVPDQDESTPTLKKKRNKKPHLIANPELLQCVETNFANNFNTQNNALMNSAPVKEKTKSKSHDADPDSSPCLEATLNSQNNSIMNQHNSVRMKKKKKRKRHQDVFEQIADPVSSQLFQINIEDKFIPNDSPSKKTKKHQQKHNISEANQETFPSTTTTTSKTVNIVENVVSNNFASKKKHKREHNISEANKETLLLNCQTVNSEHNDFTSIKKKSKHKSKPQNQDLSENGLGEHGGESQSQQLCGKKFTLDISSNESNFKKKKDKNFSGSSEVTIPIQQTSKDVNCNISLQIFVHREANSKAEISSGSAHINKKKKCKHRENEYQLSANTLSNSQNPILSFHGNRKRKCSESQVNSSQSLLESGAVDLGQSSGGEGHRSSKRRKKNKDVWNLDEIPSIITEDTRRDNDHSLQALKTKKKEMRTREEPIDLRSSETEGHVKSKKKKRHREGQIDPRSSETEGHLRVKKKKKKRHTRKEPIDPRSSETVIEGHVKSKKKSRHEVEQIDPRSSETVGHVKSKKSRHEGEPIDPRSSETEGHLRVKKKKKSRYEGEQIGPRSSETEGHVKAKKKSRHEGEQIDPRSSEMEGHLRVKKKKKQREGLIDPRSSEKEGHVKSKKKSRHEEEQIDPRSSETEGHVKSKKKSRHEEEQIDPRSSETEGHVKSKKKSRHEGEQIGPRSSEMNSHVISKKKSRHDEELIDPRSSETDSYVKSKKESRYEGEQIGPRSSETEGHVKSKKKSRHEGEQIDPKSPETDMAKDQVKIKKKKRKKNKVDVDDYEDETGGELDLHLPDITSQTKKDRSKVNLRNKPEGVDASTLMSTNCELEASKETSPRKLRERKNRKETSLNKTTEESQEDVTLEDAEGQMKKDRSKANVRNKPEGVDMSTLMSTNCELEASKETSPRKLRERKNRKEMSLNKTTEESREAVTLEDAEDQTKNDRSIANVRNKPEGVDTSTLMSTNCELEASKETSPRKLRERKNRKETSLNKTTEESQEAVTLEDAEETPDPTKDISSREKIKKSKRNQAAQNSSHLVSPSDDLEPKSVQGEGRRKSERIQRQSENVDNNMAYKTSNSNQPDVDSVQHDVEKRSSAVQGHSKLTCNNDAKSSSSTKAKRSPKKNVNGDKLNEDVAKVTGSSSDKVVVSESVLFVPSNIDVIIHPRNVLELVSAKQRRLKESLKEIGFHLRGGRWLKQEDDKLQANWNQILKDHPRSEPFVILSNRQCTIAEKREMKKYVADSFFYQSLATGLNRSVANCYHRARRLFNPVKNKGKYTDKDYKQVQRLLQIYGNNWTLIGKEMGRPSSSLYDMYQWRSQKQKTGPWDKTEEDSLVKAIQEVTGITDLSNLYHQIPWKQVAEKLKTRPARWCRDHWVRSLAWDVNNKESRKQWDSEDTARLLKLVRNLHEEADIDWDLLLKEFKNAVCPQYLHKRWFNLKQRLPNYKKLTFKQVCDQLSIKYKSSLEDLELCEDTEED